MQRMHTSIFSSNPFMHIFLICQMFEMFNSRILLPHSSHARSCTEMSTDDHHYRQEPNPALTLPAYVNRAFCNISHTQSDSMKCSRVERDYLSTSGILAEGFTFTGMLFKLSSLKEKQTVLAKKAGLAELS